jgi:cephalosporin-C deacetylase-like acetyl esterase
MAHDLPIDQPIDFYKQAEATTIKGYPGIGETDRDKSYFLRMFLGDVQSAQYLAQRPDWDGKTLVVTGGSQGGWQSLATAGLDPKITAVIANVPAGCDTTGVLGGRNPGWPFFLKNLVTPEQKQTLQTAVYFDSVNFAARIKCPTLIGVGLLDTIAPPSGVFTAFNQLQGPKEICVTMSDHEGHNHSQAAYEARAAAWRTALLAGQPPPLPANP